MVIRQIWKTKIRAVARLFNSLEKDTKKVSEEPEITSSAIYSDDSDDSDSDTETSNLQECFECGNKRTINWCKKCESKEFIKQFTEWSSKNQLLDKFIRNTQYKAYDHRYYWEWIPFDKFTNIQFLTNGGQSSVFTAIWSEGPRNQWDGENMRFVRRKMCKVILKRLAYSPTNIGPEFINELRKYYGHQESRCSRTVQIYGLTQDPKSACYMLVTAYHNRLDVRELIQENLELNWSDILRILHDCAEALLNIHSKGHVHKNLHPGNILLHSKGKKIFLNISDLGLHHDNQNIGEIFGVIPYVAPEVLTGWPYTQESDIYSFAMLMFELITGKPAFYDRAHDQHLIFDICEGLRPQFDVDDEIPECYVELINRCWDIEPVNRPSAYKILSIIDAWDVEDFQLEREKFEIHPDAIYTSRPLGELISRELELQDQILIEAELAEQNEEEFSEEVEEFSEEGSQEEQERESDDDSMTNSESDSDDGDKSSNSDHIIESKTNKFQLGLKLDLGDSLIDEVNHAYDTTPTSNGTDDYDDSLTESSSTSTNYLHKRSSVYEFNNLEMKHEMNNFNFNDSQSIFENNSKIYQSMLSKNKI